MNRLTISARAFHQPETLGNAIAALINWITVGPGAVGLDLS